MEDRKSGIEKLKKYETYDEFLKDMEKSVKHSSPLSYLKWFFITLALLIGSSVVFGLLLNLLFCTSIY